MSTQVSSYDYYLPQERIAQHPISPRDHSRLMVLDKNSGEIEHRIFKDIVDYLTDKDLLIMNNSRVLPARLFGIKKETDGKVELLLLKQLKPDIWEVLAKPARRIRPGTQLIFGDGQLTATVIATGEEGERVVQFHYQGIFDEIIDTLGKMPLPPYIKARLDDPERYQTVYAKERGSAAAPTAGLHFTPELLDKISRKGVKCAYLTLHVGLGTFRPVATDNILEHHMHSEYYQLSAELADQINQTRAAGGRIIAVGTTTTRTLESLSWSNGQIQPGSGWTDIFIYPGYSFKAVDALITNFHLPKSTLLMLVSAFSNRENILRAYQAAITEEYRFFSFGDAMFIK